MSKVWLVPLEPFESRYTGQWYREFPKAFIDAGAEVTMIDGEVLVNHIDKGSWLPINSTVHYKATQLAKIAKAFQNNEVHNDDVFFVFDLEFHGIEVIRSLATLNKINVRINAFLHAASYTKEDLMEQLAPWQQYTELGWLAMCDKVFVGSKYHRDAFIERRIKPFITDSFKATELIQKIHVTGNPVFKNEYLAVDVDKKKQIILPNRFDFEKRPNISLDIAYIIKKKHPDWNIVVTTSNKKMSSNKAWLLEKLNGMVADGIVEVRENLSKAEYHATIAESKVMLTNSIEENFGYVPVEAMIYGTYPLMPNNCSHPELCNNYERLLFNDIDEVVSKIEYLMEHATFSVTGYPVRYFNSVNEIVSHCFTN